MKRLAVSFIVFFLSCLHIGCFIYNPAADFVKQRYTNTVSYFNTFYNAQRAFDEAEQEVLNAQKEFREKPVPGRQFVIPQSARTKFTSSIEKNSKILSFYPTSKWVDDALLMIGKAYYYLDDDVRAERKFLELATKFPESDLINESELFLGRSLIRQKKYSDGIKHLEALYTKSLQSDDNTAGLAAYELGQYYFAQNDFTEAEKNYSVSLPLIDDEELQALIQYQIAQCYDNLKNYRQAEQEYQKVSKYEPGYTLLFNSNLSRARTLVQQKKYAEAIEMMDDMLNDTKNIEFYPSIHFEIANAFSAQGDLNAAKAKYSYVDTTFARTDEAAKSYYALAQIYEQVHVNYDSARLNYVKARSEFPSSKITSDAARKAEIFTKYDTFRKDLARFDSLLTNTIFQKAKDDSLSAAVADSLKAEKKDTAESKPLDPKSIKAIRPAKRSETKTDSIAAVDSTKIKAQRAKDLAYTQLLDSLQRSILRTKFELGGLFFLELQVPDSALYWYQQVVNEHPQSEFAARALYTIAEIYRTVKEQPQNVRDSVYALLIQKFPASPYAQEARKVLGLPIIIAGKDTVEELLERAEAFADTHDFLSAIKVYKLITERYPKSSLAPKALYSTAWYFENAIVNNDSALAVYRRLITQYPSSHYVSLALPKVTEYENEQKRIEEEKKKQSEEQKRKEQKEKEEKEPQIRQEPIQPDSLSVPKNKL
jgi:TolA-binding protein